MSHTERLKEIISGLTDRVGLVDFYIQEASTLPRKNNKLIISDMDDTLLSRSRLSEEEALLRENRGQEWNKVVINHFGIHNIVERFYTNQNPPQDIVNIMKQNDENLIMTAWVPEYALMKARAWNLDCFPVRVTESWEDKITETIRYILFELKYIPSEIIVYEDRPQYFIQYRELIEWVLGCELTIMKVVMDGNDGYKSIEQD